MNPDLPPAVANSYACPNGHTRINPPDLVCTICGKLMEPDKGRGDVTLGEIAKVGIKAPMQNATFKPINNNNLL